MICIYQLNFTCGTYIGKTTNLRARIAHHLRRENCGSKLQEAWETQTYIGYVILEECSIEELNAKEVYWISTRNPSLNTLPGGETLSGLNHPRNKCTKEEVEEIVRLLELGFKFSVIAEQLNLPYSRVYDICTGKAHTWATDHLNLEVYKSKNSKPLVVFDEYNIEHVIRYGTKEEFCVKNNMPKTALNLVSDKANKYGYSTTRHKEYLVTSPAGEEVLTLYQLQRAVKEEKSAAYLLNRLLKGKSCKGWKITLV
jgi:hypothetical protein